MEKHSFRISIDSSPEIVWDVLWSDATYSEWTSVFSPGSRAESDWKEGSKILFLDGNGHGMVSKIEVMKPNQFMSFKHLGEIHGGVEDTTSEKVSQWSGALENYILKNVNGQTELTVEVDMTDEFKDFFLDTFPKALEKLKSIAERSKQETVMSPS
jgi:hypothetical protein